MSVVSQGTQHWLKHQGGFWEFPVLSSVGLWPRQSQFSVEWTHNFGKVAATGKSKDVLGKAKAGAIWCVPNQVERCGLQTRVQRKGGAKQLIDLSVSRF